MKVLGICGSPRKGGNTETVVNEALGGALQEGAEVDLFCVSGKHIEPCDGCRTCSQTGVCHIQDDMQDLYKRMLAADAIIFATPTYSYSMTSQMKMVIDRSRAMRSPSQTNQITRLANKVGGVIAIAGSLGLIGVVKDLYFHIITNYMLPAGHVALYALNKGDCDNRINGKRAAFNLGRQMVRLANMKFAYPAELMKEGHAYGTWDQ